MPPKLRYEFYLPTSYNDGTPIDASKYRLVKNKIIEKFKAISIHPATIQGIWTSSAGQVLYDNCYRFEITADKSPENEEFFEHFKKELKNLFNQQEIYMICTEVNWIL